MAYTLSAGVYDLLIGKKDYARASSRLVDLFETLAPDASTLLDIGCGTGRHLEYFQERYTVAGVDRSRHMLKIARRRCPLATLRRGDMTTLALRRRFDIVTCLFGTIGYARSIPRLRRAVACMKDHVRPGGLLVIEPWLTPERFIDGQFVHDTATDGAVTVTRMYTTRREGDLSVCDIRYLVGSTAGISRFSERHELGLFTDAEYRDAIAAADLRLVDEQCELFGYGMYAATRRRAVRSARDGRRRTGHATTAVADPRPPIPVLRPLLPRARALLPYLRRIDASRIYSNHGPLVQEFETRLAEHLGLPSAGIASASSGTSALVGAILAVAGRARPERPLALMPAFTFVATAVAAEQCGYVPYLLDVDPVEWTLDADRCAGAQRMREVGVVIVVAPFGRAVPQSTWQEWTRRTSIPVVIDAAASFEAVSAPGHDCLGRIPVAMSFHATKSLGTGEGGCVASTDTVLTARAALALNYGFDLSRDSLCACTNGKMSEYHAAVGLAGLDGLMVQQRAIATAVDCYRRHLHGAGIADRFITAPEVCSSYALMRCADEAESLRVQRSLRDSGIEYRHWYGAGLHRHPHFAATPREVLPVTERLAACILGLPMAPDLSASGVARIVSAVRAGLGQQRD